jgi:NADH dehydrogenase
MAEADPGRREPHVVIAGGGFGGLWAARALAREPLRVTLVDRRNHHVFQPLLYQVATGVLSPADIAAPIRGILRRQRNVDVLLADVHDVDLAGRRVQCGERWLEYDALILACGMVNHWFGHDDWARHAPALKSLDDALEIRRRVYHAFERAEWTANPDERRRLLTFVVVGGGPTGVELAGALSEIAHQTLLDDFRHIDPQETRVVLVEGGARVLGGFRDPLPEKARRHLLGVGVELRTGQRVMTVDDQGVRVGQERLAAATVLWAAGVEASPLGRKLGVPIDAAGRVEVQPDLSIAGHEEVFVIGDMAKFPTADGRGLPGVAQVAMQMGAHVARNLRDDRLGQSRKPFRYKDLGSMATIGRRLAVADVGGMRFGGFLAWVAWLLVHLMQLIGFRNRLVVLVSWAWSYVTLQRNTRLIRGGDDAGSVL